MDIEQQPTAIEEVCGQYLQFKQPTDNNLGITKVGLLNSQSL